NNSTLHCRRPPTTACTACNHMQPPATACNRLQPPTLPVPPLQQNRLFLPTTFTCRNCGGGDRGRVAIYRPFGEFRRANLHCHLYGAQGQRQAYLLPMPR
ncbi:hypothetical protein TNCV_4783421, partial [Trichonephila clavipes]